METTILVAAEVLLGLLGLTCAAVLFSGPWPLQLLGIFFLAASGLAFYCAYEIARD